MKMEHGKYADKDIEWVADNDPSYLLFIYTKPNFFGGVIKSWIFNHLDELRKKAQPRIDNQRWKG